MRSESLYYRQLSWQTTKYELVHGYWLTTQPAPSFAQLLASPLALSTLCCHHQERLVAVTATAAVFGLSSQKLAILEHGKHTSKLTPVIESQAFKQLNGERATIYGCRSRYFVVSRISLRNVKHSLIRPSFRPCPSGVIAHLCDTLLPRARRIH